MDDDSTFTAAGGGAAPPELAVPMRQMSALRYGENPHQAAAVYADLSLAEAGRGGIAGATQHHGKEVLLLLGSPRLPQSETLRSLDATCT